jgi:hypothetical protein
VKIRCPPIEFLECLAVDSDARSAVEDVCDDGVLG